MIKVKVEPILSDNLFMKIFNKKCDDEGHLGCNQAHPWRFVGGNIYEQLALAVTLFLVAPHAAQRQAVIAEAAGEHDTRSLGLFTR